MCASGCKLLNDVGSTDVGGGLVVSKAQRAASDPTHGVKGPGVNVDVVVLLAVVDVLNTCGWSTEEATTCASNFNGRHQVDAVLRVTQLPIKTSSSFFSALGRILLAFKLKNVLIAKRQTVCSVNLTASNFLFDRHVREDIVRRQVKPVDASISSAVDHVARLAELLKLRSGWLFACDGKISVSRLLGRQLSNRSGDLICVHATSKGFCLFVCWLKAKITLGDCCHIGLRHQSTSVVIELDVRAIIGLEVHDLLRNASSVFKDLLAVLDELALRGQGHAVG